MKPWMLRSSRVIIAPTPSLRCIRSGMLWSRPTVASSSVKWMPSRVCQLVTLPMPSRSRASTSRNPTPLSSTRFTPAVLSPSKTYFRTRGSAAPTAESNSVSRVIVMTATL